VWLAGDPNRLAERAAQGLGVDVEVVPGELTGSRHDTISAAAHMSTSDVRAVVVLGGDGTHRDAAKGWPRLPLVAISTGTNNVFPTMMESTIAGMAAGLLATNRIDMQETTYRAKRLEVWVDGQMKEIALIDVVASAELFIGSRALWDTCRIREVVLARAQPDCIGMSSIGGCLSIIGPHEPRGMYLHLGGGGPDVLAPVGPGQIAPVGVQSWRWLSMDEEIALQPAACTIAVDGERQIEAFEEQEIRVRLTAAGPRVADVSKCLNHASRAGILRPDAM